MERNVPRRIYGTRRHITAEREGALLEEWRSTLQK